MNLALLKFQETLPTMFYAVFLFRFIHGNPAIGQSQKSNKNTDCQVLKSILVG